MSTNPPKLADLQLEYEQAPSLLKGDSPGKEWLDIPVVFRDGNWCHAAKPNVIEDLGFNNPRKWSPADEDWKLEEGWQKNCQRRHEGTFRQIPFLQIVHGHLCQVRCLFRQMPFLFRQW